MTASWGDPPPGASRELGLALGRLEKGRAKAIREGRPEWVMLGVDWDGPGVLLVASRSLTAAELDFRSRRQDFASWEHFSRPGAFRPELTLYVHMHNDYVVVAGPTYAECLAALMQQWSPDERDRPALMGGPS
jgi:hypothetical protein